MKFAVTLSLVPEARGGPFVFWDDLDAACSSASQLGFDAIEIFAPSASELNVRQTLDRYNLKLAAVGTGGGWVLHRLTLTSPDPATRQRARDFIRSLIDAAAELDAPTIVGSMQGRWDQEVDRQTALQYLTHALNELGEHARSRGVPLLFEPLNRYETNIVNTLADGTALLRSLTTTNVKLLGDLFHMNIEESNLPRTIREAASAIGHVHLADSNRRPAGNGHTDFSSVSAALREIGYQGHISAECLPWPDPRAAAKQTIDCCRKFFGETG